MKVIILLAAASIGVVLGEAPSTATAWKPQGAFLVLPSRQVQGTYGYPLAPEEAQDQPEVTDDVAEVNKTMERLRQKEGSETGVYYVLLPDGRLQRIQYTTAPIKEQQEEENQNYNQQGSDQGSNYKRQQNEQGFNYNQQTPNQKGGKFNQQESSQQEQAFKGHYVQLQAQNYAAQNQQSASNQANRQARFPGEQSRGYNTEEARQEAGENEQETKEPNKFVAEFGRARIVMMPNPPASYVASVQYSDVDPITDPIYSYNAAPLVRILRRA